MLKADNKGTAPFFLNTFWLNTWVKIIDNPVRGSLASKWLGAGARLTSPYVKSVMPLF